MQLARRELTFIARVYTRLLALRERPAADLPAVLFGLDVCPSDVMHDGAERESTPHPLPPPTATSIFLATLQSAGNYLATRAPVPPTPYSPPSSPWPTAPNASTAFIAALHSYPAAGLTSPHPLPTIAPADDPGKRARNHAHPGLSASLPPPVYATSSRPAATARTHRHACGTEPPPTHPHPALPRFDTAPPPSHFRNSTSQREEARLGMR